MLDDFLWPYGDGAKYLKYAEDSGHCVRGHFRISQSVYLKPGFASGHLNLVDAIICLNQLAYVGIADRIRRDALPELPVTYGYLLEHLSEHMIYGADRIRFHRLLQSGSFSCCLRISDVSRRRQKYFIRTEYDFEKAACGRLGFVVAAPHPNNRL